jgi:hypothetical protein
MVVALLLALDPEATAVTVEMTEFVPWRQRRYRPGRRSLAHGSDSAGRLLACAGHLPASSTATTALAIMQKHSHRVCSGDSAAAGPRTGAIGMTGSGARGKIAPEMPRHGA